MLNRITNSAASGKLGQLTSEVSGSPYVQRRLRLAAQQVNPRLPVKPLRLQTTPRQKPAKVALAEHEVELLHLIDQLTTGFAQAQRGPTILDGVEAGRETLGCAFEISRLYGITENLVERYFGKLVFRQPPGNFGGEAVAVQLVVGHMHLLDRPALGKLARLAETEQLAIPIGRTADEAGFTARIVKRGLQIRICQEPV